MYWTWKLPKTSQPFILPYSTKTVFIELPQTLRSVRNSHVYRLPYAFVRTHTHTASWLLLYRT